jgi:hypothetical protein
LDSEDADFHGAWSLKKKRKAKFVKPNGAHLRRRPLQKRNRSKDRPAQKAGVLRGQSTFIIKSLMVRPKGPTP